MGADCQPNRWAQNWPAWVPALGTLLANVAFVVWLAATLSADLKNVGNRLDKIEQAQKDRGADDRDIVSRLGRIEGQLAANPKGPRG